MSTASTTAAAAPATPSGRKLKAAILGATGTVGQRFLTLLAAHPFFTVHAVCASPRSAGKPYAEAANWKLAGDVPEGMSSLIVEPCTVVPGSRLAECDVAFSGLDSSVATEVEAHIALAGIPVFSNAKNFRMHPHVPLVVPTANADQLAPMVRAQLDRGANSIFAKDATSPPAQPKAGGYMVTNSNCSTTGLAVILRPLIDTFGPIDQMSVVTLQAVSGAGYPGLPVLDVFDNVVPYIGGEEDKLETEPHKILGKVDAATGKLTHIHQSDMKVTAACNRVPVLDGHTLNISLRFKNRDAVPTPDQIASVLAAYTPPPADVLSKCPSCPAHAIHVASQPDRPQPRLDRDRGQGMTVTVGRIRECALLDIKLVTLTHNTVLGAAGSSLLNAEVAYVQGLLKARD
ncbi:aspartate-semialdehyde dehydrogenase [Catenaria anguillulae PL171]|uniref:Aspartate-semialdehyde dehydrogenase n=1 Tax=Catenaria anguillulae PL171 TaxID=765915 RepID=A0A1Y2HMK9_9FUNG|nr:aspartate-semialdehyde dehydrogenase [Catenaria anguillulae PL171]